MNISESKINEVGRRIQENSNLIWNAANSLFGAFKPHEYGLVILPMCIIKRQSPLPALEAEGQAVVLADSLCEDPLPHQQLSSRCHLTWWRNKEALWGLTHKGTNPIHEGPTFMH